MSVDPEQAGALRRKVAEQYGAGIPVSRSFRVPDLGPDSPLRPEGRRSPGRAAKPKRDEHAIQRAFFAKVNDPAEQWHRPDLATVYAIPNGGARSAATAGRLKAEGVRAGVLDVHCPVARGGFVGLWLEFKVPGGQLSAAQLDWMVAMEARDHAVYVVDDALGAWAILTEYLDQPATRTSCASPAPPSSP